ncbi:hypothetical protein MTO96_023982 [Rhipicephalus appendiculatus]
MTVILTGGRAPTTEERAFFLQTLSRQTLKKATHLNLKCSPNQRPPSQSRNRCVSTLPKSTKPFSGCMTRILEVASLIPPELLALEERCAGMGPLIEQELERIDRRHASLVAASRQLTDAFTLYHSLMRAPPPPPQAAPPMPYGPVGEGAACGVQDPRGNMAAGLPPQMPMSPPFSGAVIPATSMAGQGAAATPVGFPLL